MSPPRGKSSHAGNHHSSYDGRGHGRGSAYAHPHRRAAGSWSHPWRVHRHWGPRYHYYTALDLPFLFWFGFPVIVHETHVVVMDSGASDEEWYDAGGDDWSSDPWEGTENGWDSMVTEESIPIEDTEDRSEALFAEMEEMENSGPEETFVPDSPEELLPPGENMGTFEPSPEASTQEDPGFQRGMEAEVLRLINLERQAHGLTPLQSESRLQEAARSHSRNMSKLGFFSHESPAPGEATLPDRLSRVGLTNYGWAGENIAMSSQPEAAQFVEMWMQSPGHRANILRPEFRYVGTGIYFQDGKAYATQEFSSEQ